MSSTTFFLSLLSLSSLALAHNHHHSPLNGHALARNMRKPTPTTYSELLSRDLQARYVGNSSGLEDTCGDESSIVSAISKNYPSSGNVASLVAGDTVASALYAAMTKDATLTALTIAPKGTSGANEQGTFTGYSYPSTDPDCWWTYNTCVTPKHGLKPDISTCPEPYTWGLTLDDGPSCQHAALYDYLLEKQQKATMFFIGANVITFPLEAQRAITDGHAVCCHTWSHHYTTALTTEQVFAELYYCKKIIADVLGMTTRCFRPPYGDTDDRVRTIATYLDMVTVIWDNDTNDWEIDDPGYNASVITKNFDAIIAQANPRNGTLVLDHELIPDDMNEFIAMYPSVAAAYHHVVPMHTCQNISSPYAEGQYIFPNFAEYVAGDRNTTYPTNWTISPVSLIFSQTGVPSSTTAAPTSTASSTSVTSLVSQSGSSGKGGANSNSKSSGAERLGGAWFGVGVGMVGMLFGMMMM